MPAREALVGEVFGAGGHGFPNLAAEPAHREWHRLTLDQPMIEPGGARRGHLPGKIDVRSVREHQRRPLVIAAAEPAHADDSPSSLSGLAKNPRFLE